MKRQRYIAADPARTTAETYEAIVQLVVDALPRATDVREELLLARSFISYLVRTEATAETPLVLLAGDDLDCALFTVHGMAALSTEAAIAPPGGARAADWTLCIPVPMGAPFGAFDVTSASAHFATERPQTKARERRLDTEASGRLLINADDLRKAVR